MGSPCAPLLQDVLAVGSRNAISMGSTSFESVVTKLISFRDDSIGESQATPEPVTGHVVLGVFLSPNCGNSSHPAIHCLDFSKTDLGRSIMKMLSEAPDDAAAPPVT